MMNWDFKGGERKGVSGSGHMRRSLCMDLAVDGFCCYLRVGWMMGWGDEGMMGATVGR